MVKPALFIMSCLFVLSAVWGQVRPTGGGPDTGRDRRNWEAPYDSGARVRQQVEAKFNELAKYIISSNERCQHLIKFGEQDNIMAIYYKLALYKANYKEAVACGQEPSEHYFSCISTDDSKKLMKAILRDHVRLEYLKVRFNLDEASAKEVIKLLEEACYYSDRRP